MVLVISQSMLFPWVGLLEQVRLADVFVHYDDVQLPSRGFNNRVQVKTRDGLRWMTVPLAGARRGQRIDEARVLAGGEWRKQHLSLLERSFADAPHAQDALQLARDTYAIDHPDLASLARASLMALCHYFGLDADTRFVDSASLCASEHGSGRILAIARALGATRYVTGHGGANYLDHEAFEREGIAVEYMHYRCTPYPQSHGAFTPYVCGLDLVAHCGRAGAAYIGSPAMPWREFLVGLGEREGAAS